MRLKGKRFKNIIWLCIWQNLRENPEKRAFLGLKPQKTCKGLKYFKIRFCKKTNSHQGNKARKSIL